MNGDRHNGFGSRMSSQKRGFSQALASTRDVLSDQSPAAPFETTPATSHRTCADCGHANPTRAMHCRRCGRDLA